jgi:glycine/D-amino acid oxidase-like deaminating enzyme
MRTVVLGGGIVGMWTADILSRLGHEVTVMSRSAYPSTTSAAAVCVLTPFFPGDPTTPTFQRGVRWARETLTHMQSLDRDGRLLEKLPCYEFGLDGMLEADFPLSKLDYLDFAEFNVINLRHKVADCNFAVGFECYLCNTRVFLPWLYDSLASRNVRFEAAVIRVLADVETLDATIVFNCLGYQSVFPDDELYPVRGQSMFIPLDTQPPPHFGLGAGHHAVFKHRRGFYIGSYFIDGINTSAPLQELYERSLDFAKGPFVELCESIEIEPPKIDLTRIESVSAGIRPFRRSGPRLEVEKVGGVTVIHNYGHGAHGWTVGYASAQEAVRLAGLAE